MIEDVNIEQNWLVVSWRAIDNYETKANKKWYDFKKEKVKRGNYKKQFEKNRNNQTNQFVPKKHNR